MSWLNLPTVAWDTETDSPDPTEAHIVTPRTPLGDLAAAINDNARARGSWESDRNFAEMLMLVMSELFEALEERREGRPPVWWQHRQPCPAQSDGLPDDRTEVERELACSRVHCKPEGTAVELADALIRILDMMHSLGVDIDAVVADKEYLMKHGKAY